MGRKPTSLSGRVKTKGVLTRSRSDIWRPQNENIERTCLEMESMHGLHSAPLLVITAAPIGSRDFNQKRAYATGDSIRKRVLRLVELRRDIRRRPVCMGNWFWRSVWSPTEGWEHDVTVCCYTWRHGWIEEGRPEQNRILQETLPNALPKSRGTRGTSAQRERGRLLAGYRFSTQHDSSVATLWLTLLCPGCGVIFSAKSWFKLNSR